MAGMALILALVLLNVVTRAIERPLYWVDEAAVLTMVFVTFVGASLLVHLRMDFAVTLLVDPLPAGLRHAARVVADLLVLFFGLLMVVLCWWWFDLPGIAAFGWEMQPYFAETFNGIYMERPNTIPLRKFWFFLIMPWFALTLSLHATTNLLADVGAMMRRAAFEERHEAEV